MQRETLLAILGSARGLTKDGGLYRVQDDYEFAVYVGQLGRAAAIDHVLTMSVPETHVEVEARDRGTLYLAYDAIHGVIATSRKERKGGGSGVGF